MPKRILHSPKLPPPLGAYSQAIEVSGPVRMLYVSGLTAQEPDGSCRC